jgi:hypothetical protein
MNENEEKEGTDFSEYARTRPPGEPQRSGVGRFLRGCGIALGIAFLVLLFGVGACFLAVG